MQINGMKIPIALIASILIGGIWLGTLNATVTSNEQHQNEHEQSPAHDKTIADIATFKADLKNVKESITRIEAQQKEDKEEILEAIREK